MSEPIDGQTLVKSLLNNKESGHELPKKISNANAETSSVRKREAGVLSAEKRPKSISQGFPKQSIERGFPS